MENLRRGYATVGRGLLRKISRVSTLSSGMEQRSEAPTRMVPFQGERPAAAMTDCLRRNLSLSAAE